eukprot:TRINITY_DN1966_c0_g1_i1.p1 TRINITY_DN1966_c0_g1~~TRINITY_DN1966_c0_g1_i1.p1  ORF type:complete len:382 (-),score=68.50 TRINITY_DN1966_c0_g1_i1:197-1342(-)
MKNPYTGLKNLGATAYLNCALQMYYMTPEFRKIMYEWDFNGYARHEFDNKMVDDQNYSLWLKEFESKCIPRQIQLLFVKLGLKEDDCVSTNGLIKSFGWGDQEQYVKHDVQEFIRILCDVLENIWKGSQYENGLKDLYQWEMNDVVECKDCAYTNCRIEFHFDISLGIRSYCNDSISSLEEAISLFIEPEELSGDNQYNCFLCKKYSDAMKSLSFHTLPYILTIHLKRIEFDFMTMQIKKNHDLFVFQEILNMNQFMRDSHEKSTKPTEYIDTRITEEDIISRNQLKIEEYQLEGPYVYELYGVISHIGSAIAGRYVCYAKSFDENQWFKFNNSMVSKTTRRNVLATCGDHRMETAYILYYRKIDPEKNLDEADINMMLQQ